ncbi:DUF4350 domain-containing protein [Natronobiforma cellulositropha]|uniref:DUF4350 domain-containing protein n=1 Tax=Natronobiforma cellulositropha TaxID=1679076 RepID=UPI0021D60C32|nr:DUF4350 domain-containing protein [Natronobiforma cellulositropha]
MSRRLREWVVEDGRVDWPRALLAGLVVAIVLSLAVVASTSTTAFDPYNAGWEGMTDFREEVESDPAVESRVVQDATQYDRLDAAETVVFVIAPEARYDEADATRVREFVERGGTLVVLENFGEPGNALLADVGAEARVDGRVVRDERHYHRGPVMPVATEVENHTYTAGVERLTLNYASAVEPGEATPLVRTSAFATLTDEDGRTEFDSYPVATVEPLGEGEVVTVGDPSIAINVMYGEPDNAALLTALSSSRSTVALDISHVADVPPLTRALLTVRATPTLQVAFAAAGVLVVGGLSSGHLRRVPALVRATARRRREGVESDGASAATLTDDERVAFLRRRHPEWSEARIQRVIGGINEEGVEGRLSDGARVRSQTRESDGERVSGGSAGATPKRGRYNE